MIADPDWHGRPTTAESVTYHLTLDAVELYLTIAESVPGVPSLVLIRSALQHGSPQAVELDALADEITEGLARVPLPALIRALPYGFPVLPRRVTGHPSIEQADNVRDLVARVLAARYLPAVAA